LVQPALKAAHKTAWDALFSRSHGAPLLIMSLQTCLGKLFSNVEISGTLGCHAGLTQLNKAPPQIEKPKRRAFVFCGLMGYPSDAAAPGVLRKVTYCGRRIGLESRWGGIVHDNLW